MSFLFRKKKLRKEKLNLKENKKGSIQDHLGWIIFFVIVLIIVLFALMLFTDKGKSAMDYIRNLFRFWA